MAPKRPSSVQYGNTLSHCTRFGPIQVIFHSKIGEKQSPKRPQLLALGPKITPKWPKMAPKGPHQYSMAKHCPTVSDFGPFRPLWAQKNGETGSKMTQTGPNPLALLGDHKSQGQFIGSTFSTFSHLFINRRNDLSQKLLGKNSHQRAGLYSF